MDKTNVTLSEIIKQRQDAQSTRTMNFNATVSSLVRVVNDREAAEVARKKKKTRDMYIQAHIARHAKDKDRLSTTKLPKLRRKIPNDDGSEDIHHGLIWI